MKTPDTGGYVYPDPCGAHPGSHPPTERKGMTLRQWYAGQFMSGILACSLTSCDNDVLIDTVFEIADAMIAHERKEMEQLNEKVDT